MNVLFVVPKNKSLLGHKYTIPGHPHIGIAYLGAFLIKQGYLVKVYDDGLGNNISLEDMIREFNPELIGVTSFSYCYGHALDCINRIKDNFDIPVVLGGPHVSAVRKEVLRDSRADFAIKKEGEYGLVELIDYLEYKERDLIGIHNLIWRKEGEIVENEEAPFIDNLDEIPFPNYSIFDIEKYSSTKNHSTPIITSRGCPFKCTYCATLLSMGRGFRKRSPENVFGEIKERYSEGYRDFTINDDCFSLDLDRADKIFELIIDSNLKIGLKCFNGFRVDRISSSLFEKMKKAGFYFLAFGCESGNQKVLDNIKKNITLEQVRKAVDLANQSGIDCCVNFIIGHPTETYSQALDTLKFAKSLNCNYVNFSNLIPYPGTEAYEWVENNAVFLFDKSSYLKDLSTYDDMPIFETPEFTKEQRIEVTKLGHEYYYRRILVWRLGRTIGSVIFLISKVPFLRRILSDFALNNKIGQSVYNFLSGQNKKS